jgi:hypothetical protein
LDDRGFNEAFVSATESVEQGKGVRVKLGDALEDLFFDMVCVGVILQGYVVVVAYVGDEPLERRRGSFTVIGLAFILFDVYLQALDVNGIVNLVQFSLYGLDVAYQASESVAFSEFDHIGGEVA